MTTLLNKLVSFTDNYDLPVVLIDDDGYIRKYPSIRYLIGLIPHSDILKHSFYVNGASQLDLNGEDNFAIIYITYENNEV